MTRTLITLFILLSADSFSQDLNDSIFHRRQIDSLELRNKIEESLIRSPQHKYYVYAETWMFLYNKSLHFEKNIINRDFYADYFDFSLGYYYDDAWVHNYTNTLQGRYCLLTSAYYVFLKKKRHLCYELDFGAVAGIGDGIARTALQKKQTETKVLIMNYLGVGLRYNFKKNPIQIRISGSFWYSFQWKEYIPILPSFSIGYGFVKIYSSKKNKKFN